MQSFLCAEFLDFWGRLCGASPQVLGVRVCSPGTCPGPEHVREWADLVARRNGVPAGDLLRRFGTALFGRLIRGYPAFLVGIESTIDLVSRYEENIAAEVRKLSDTARLPEISLRRRSGGEIEVTYHSPRGLAHLAEGLLLGSIAYFGESFVVERGETADDAPEHAVFRLVTPAPR